MILNNIDNEICILTTRKLTDDELGKIQETIDYYKRGEENWNYNDIKEIFMNSVISLGIYVKHEQDNIEC